MTRIDFHFNVGEPIAYGCRLVRRIHRAGQRVIVYADSTGLLARLDTALWTFSPLDFIPHVFARDPLAAQTPVLLTDDGADLPHHDVLVNLSDTEPPLFARYLRLVEVVGTGDESRLQARERWRRYREHGYPIASHDVSAVANRLQ